MGYSWKSAPLKKSWPIFRRLLFVIRAIFSVLCCISGGGLALWLEGSGF